MPHQNQKHSPLSPKPSNDDVSCEIQNTVSANVSEQSLVAAHEERIVNGEPAIVQGVRIQPAKLLFLHTFDAKKFAQTVVIQNCGKNPAFVQYDCSNNHALSFTPLKRGKRLSSGMKIILNVNYTYVQHCALATYSIPIFINSEMFPLKIIVSAPTAKISVEPTHIDFGIVDIGYHVSRRTIKLKNSGSKLCRFNIHMGSNEVNINVEPSTGVLQPYSELRISVEVSSLEEGYFKADFIITCVQHIRVIATGTVMVGKLEICNMASSNDFTLIEFPKTYYDTKCTQRLVLRNNSAARTVFCALFNDDEKAEKEDSKCFSISPMDGRLEPREAKIFTIEYKPTWAHKVASFHFATLTIKKLNFWKDMNVTDYPRGLYYTLKNYKSPEFPRRKNMASSQSLNHTISESFKAISFLDSRSNSSYMSNTESLLNEPYMDLEYRIQVCLHGEPEMVNVSCSPNELNVQNLIINNPVDRVLCITNNSKCLNIQFAYEKVAYINIQPKSGTLEPNTSIDTKVTLHVCNLGKITTNIYLLLFYNNSSIDGIDNRIEVGKIRVPVILEANYHTKKAGVQINMGITPKYLKEVGKNADLVAHNNLDVAIPRQTIDPSMRKQRKNDTAFIAFPNDRPRSLRPWTLTANPIETIYAKIPRGIADSTSVNNIKKELAIRDQTRKYYANYLKYSRMHLLTILHSNELPDYEITKTKQYLLYRYFADFVGDKSVDTSNGGMVDSFIPLTPLQLNRIVVAPVYISVGLVAPYSKTSKSFSITNDNDLSIRVYVIPEKQRFTFPRGEGMIVKSNTTKTVDFIFYSEFEGNHILCIRIVVNECHIFEVSVYANVTHKRLYKSSNNLEFNPQDPPYKFINLYNPLNVQIDFNWLPSGSNFSVEPVEGKIPPLKAMACMVTYNPLRNKLNSVDLVFQTTPVHKQRCAASAGLMEINTSLCVKEVNFGLVPMNIKHTKQAVLWNLSNCTIYFSITKPAVMSGLQIIPERGFLKTKTAQIFTVTLNSLNCVPFKYVIIIHINEKPAHEFSIIGNVLFPVVMYSPNPYRLKKFPVTSYVRFAITIANKTKAPVFISFDFHLHMNCFISEYKDSERFHKAKITLEANRNKLLYVSFEPKDVTSLWFHMPFVLNNILGPPTGPYAIASKTHTYIKNQSIKVNPTIPILRVFTIISESDFVVSKDYFEFLYHPYDSTKNYCDDKTTFTNASEKVLEFSIHLDTLFLPFDLFYESGVEVQMHSSYITFTLQPGDYTTLAVTFTPEKHGSFSSSVPFYVRHDYQEAVHNYIRLFALYELPTITVPDTIYLEYMPLKFKLEKSFFAYPKNHSSECILSTWCDIENLQIFVRSKSRNDSFVKYEICIIYTSTYSESLKSSIKFTCTCGSFAEVTCIGVSENSLITTFKVVRNANERIILSQSLSKQSDQTNGDDAISHIMARDMNTFPYFPQDGEDDYEISMETLHVLESWLFCQAFSGKLKFKIPDHFSIMMPLPRSEVEPKKNLTSPLKHVIPYVELLKEIASPGIAEKIGTTISYTTEEELANELFCLYRRVLRFLTEMDARLPHVEPEFLLDYDLYVTYMTKIKNDHIKLAQPPTYQNSNNFYLLSKQSWLDVLLQTLKIFIVARIKVQKSFNPLTTLSSKATIDVEQVTNLIPIKKYSSNQMVAKSTGHHIFSTIEFYLLNWIKYYYTNYIGEICQTNLELMAEKQIDDYDSSFMDSLVLATLIVGHCPYLKYGLSNLYWMPSSTEHFHHNAAVVVQALSMINSTFELMPRNIYNSNNVQMVLLVAYLHEFLPNLTPRNTITVTAKLSATSSIKISIVNDNNFDVTYKMLFFENDHRCFSESRSLVNVSAGSTDYLNVKFQAKCITQVTAVLVLCGEVFGKKCAKSMAYRLIGEPDVTHVTSSFYLSTMYYTSKEHALEVQAPYKASGCYDLYVTYNQPTSYQNLKLFDYLSINRNRILFKLNLSASQVFFNEHGKGTLYLNCVALTGRIRAGWIFFRNSEIGDFCIYIEMQIMQTKEVEYLHIDIPKSIYSYNCVCANKGQNYCKKFVRLKVPKMNILLMECFKKEFLRLKGTDLAFWASYIEKPSAMRHMKKVLDTEYCVDILSVLEVLTEDKLFEVSVSGLGQDVDITVPKTLTIADVKYGDVEEFSSLYIHVANKPMKSFQLHLWYREMMEFRKYKVIVSHR